MILDLYEDVNEIRSCGQTIVYTIHKSVGHLGIFVSGSVARKEHDEFSSNIDLIDVLPPGLYEATFEPKAAASANPNLVKGDWIMRCEERTLEDIRALGGNDPDDERRFATAARVSEINLALYRAFAQPFVRASTSIAGAEWMRRMHPLRMQYEWFSEKNPLMAPVKSMARRVRENRRLAGSDNPFVAMQKTISGQIAANLDLWRSANETLAERTFLWIYGSPMLQAAVGIDAADQRRMRKAAKSPLYGELLRSRIAELKSHVDVGGLRECVIRSMLYVGITRGGADERGLAAIRRLRAAEPGSEQLTLAKFKALVREQYLLLLIDQEATLAAIPALLPADPEERRKGFSALCEVLSARGEIAADGIERLLRVARLLASIPEESPESLPGATVLGLTTKKAS